MANEVTGTGFVPVELFNQLVREFNSFRNLSLQAPLTGGVFAGGVGIGLSRKFMESLPVSGAIDAITIGNVLSSEPTWALGTAPNGVNVQWRYILELLTFNGNGLVPEGGYDGQWVPDPESKSPTIYAYNTLEIKNSRLTSGDMVHGNGVDFARLQQNFPNQKPQPAPVGALLLCFASGGFWWFSYANAIDGEC
jgi:hypothetical protein